MAYTKYKQRQVRDTLGRAYNSLLDVFEDTEIPPEERRALLGELEYWLTRTALPALDVQVIQAKAADAKAERLKIRQRLARKTLADLDVTWKGSRAFVAVYERGFVACIEGRQETSNPYSDHKAFAKTWDTGFEEARKWMTEHFGVGDTAWVKNQCEEALTNPDSQGLLSCPFTMEQVKAIMRLQGLGANCPNCYSQGNIRQCLEGIRDVLEEGH